MIRVPLASIKSRSFGCSLRAHPALASAALVMLSAPSLVARPAQADAPAMPATMAATAAVNADARADVNAADIMVNGDFSEGTEGWRTPTDNASSRVVDVAGLPFKRALQVTIAEADTARPWITGLYQTLDLSAKTGQRLKLQFWARSPQSLKTAAMIQQSKDPWSKAISQEFTLSPGWKQYEVSDASKLGFASGEAEVMFSLAYGNGVIEIGQVRLINLDETAAPKRLVPTARAPQSIIANGDFKAPLEGVWDSNGPTLVQTQIVAAEGASAKEAKLDRALRVTITPPAESKAWDVQLGQKSAVYIGRGESVYVRAWMRSAKRSTVGLVFENATTLDKFINQQATLTPEWKEYRFVGLAPQAFNPGDAQFKIFLGYGAGEAEIANVRVENWGKAPRSAFSETIDLWGGQEHSDAWRADALKRIDTIRKADFKIKVTDAKGRVVPNAQVSVAMQRQAFRWGSAVVASRLIDTSPDAVRYQAEVKRLFNTVVFENDLKWTEVTPNEAKLARIDRAIEWLKTNDIAIRGHNLVWGSKQYLPGNVLDQDKETLTKTIDARVDDYATRFKGRVYIWDVVNEATDNTELWEKIGWDKFADVFKRAHAADPNALLAYNDYDITNVKGDNGHRVRVKERIQMLIDMGAPLDIIGDQVHMGTPLTPFPKLLKNLDEMAKYGKPIEMTEFDVGLQDDKIHGDYVRDFLIASFSHPAVSAFIQWGFWEGAHWRAAEGGAMFRQDWTKRPAQLAYEDLVLKQWWTNVRGRTSARGEYATRGFLGDYEVTVSSGGKSRIVQASLAKAGKTLEVKLP